MPEVCNGRDDDCDGERDEPGAEVTALGVTFHADTLVEPGGGEIHIAGVDGPIAGSPFAGELLSGETKEVPGHLVSIRISVAEGTSSLFGYLVTAITDQDGRLGEGPFPESPHGDGDHAHPVPLDHTATYELPDALGMGTICGTEVGECTKGIFQCLGGQVVCGGDTPRVAEQCDGLDNNCDGVTDDLEGLLAGPSPPEICPLVEGVCAGTMEICRGADDYQECSSLLYGDDYEDEVETRCDCLDNNCDGVVDGNGDELLPCTIDQLAPGGADRDCVVRAGTRPEEREYTFGSLEIPADVTLTVTADGGCGYGGRVDACVSTGGGCLTLRAGRLDVAGQIVADAFTGQCVNGSQGGGGGASGGDIVLEAEEVVVSGTLRANGANGVRIANSNSGSGGGAAGSIRIRGLTVELGGQLLARGGAGIAGGRERHGQPGQGAGGAGGWGGNGGGGAGGAGGWEHAGPGRAARPIRITGGLVVIEGGSIQSVDGAGAASGTVVLEGAAAAAPDEAVTPDPTSHPLVVVLMDPARGGVEADFRIERTLDDEPIVEGRTEEGGWVVLDDELAVDLEHRLVVVGAPERSGGSVVVSYGDPASHRACTQERTLQGDPPTATLALIRDCGSEGEGEGEGEGQ